MIQSLICLLIVAVVRIAVGRLSETYDFLQSWITPCNWILIAFAVITGLLVLIKIIREVMK